MKKSLFLCALLAVLATLSSCKKEQYDTLKAIISTDSKIYIDNNRYPCWSANDRVLVNSQTITLSSGDISTVNGTCATLRGVTSSAPYYAIYPADYATIDGYSATITIPSEQTYVVDATSGKQKVKMPMTSRTTEGNILTFRNLCSIVRVPVHNSTATPKTITSIEIRTSTSTSQNGSALCGTGTVNFQWGSDFYNLVWREGTTGNGVTLSGNMTVPAHTTEYFDVVIPPFGSESARENITITITNSDNSTTVKSLTGVYADRNDYIIIKPTTTTNAHLVDGPTFRAAVSQFTGLDQIVFRSNNYNSGVDEYNHTYTNGDWTSPVIELQVEGSPKIFCFKASETVLSIQTAATNMYANSNCSTMFQNLNVANIWADNTNAFITSEVTDMSYMFAGNNGFNPPNIITNDLSTDHVITMNHMFYNCSSFTGLDLSHFTTTALTNMESIFEGCSSLQTVTLNNTGATTSLVTNMRNMFKDCLVLTEMNIDYLTINNSTDITGMCSSLNSSHGTDNNCHIYCTENAENAMKRQNTENQYISGINTSIVEFHRPSDRTTSTK